MNRDIKFRGKSTVEVFDGGDTPDINLGNWIYGSLIIDENEAYIVNGVVECTDEYISIEKWCPVDIKTVGQYTGLKDKNGVEIYEGDIVLSNHYKIPIVIEFLDRHAMFGYQRDDRKYYLAPFVDSPVPVIYQVIGNIYSNPELLERS